MVSAETMASRLTMRTLSAIRKIALAVTSALTPIGATTLNPTTAFAADKPRVASINTCTDQMVLALAEPEQILSLTFLSHDEAASVYREKALNYPTNTGTAEEVLALEPDLVLASAYTSKYTIQLLQVAGVQVKTLNIASTIEEVMSNVLEVGELLNQSDTATAIVDDMKTRLAAIPAAPDVRPRAAIFDPNGYTVGANTLRGQALELSGWHNAASDRGVQYYGTLALESLIKLNPDILVASPYSAGTWSRAQALNSHPALALAGIDADVVRIPSAKTICGGPWTVGVIEDLVKVRLEY